MAKRGRPPKAKPVEDEASVESTVSEEPVEAKGPAFDITTLGMRERTVIELCPIKVSRPGFAESLEFRKVLVKKPDLQCDLTLEEAKILVANCGEQAWTLQGKKQRWICIATHPNDEGEEIRRRFMVTQEIYEQLGS